MADVDPAYGLTREQVRDRAGRGLANVQPESPSRTTREIVRANVVTRFNILLSVLLVMILAVVQAPRDALFGIVMVTNAAIGIIQELRAKATLDRLALLTAPRARVVREGTTHDVDIAEIVVDDIVELRSGDQLPVDGEVVASRSLEINESLLTGESDPVVKEIGDPALSGSFVVAGTGRYRATRVGRNAYAAELAREAKRFTLVRSELRDGIDWILAGVSWAVGPVIVLLVWTSLRADADVRQAIASAVAGAVGMVPQGLVLLTSIAFAVGVIRLGRRNVLVQELPAIEGLARVDVVCFDKTGTLTEGSLVVQQVIPLHGGDPAAPLGALGAAEPDPNATLQSVIREFPAPDGWHAAAAVPFSSARKWSGASFDGRGTWLLGAPEILAPDDAMVASVAEEHASQGRRVLLLASSDVRLETERIPRGLDPHTILVLGDRIRPDAAATLRYFAEQGVQAKVISGDHPDTVAAIAREVGVPGSQHVVDARTLPEDAESLASVVESGTVFGRVTPYQKRAMVGALQRSGHVVAMTGDGVNDVLALKDADIGIAIGSGSAASRSVAQLVLIDGAFDTLPGVVGEGRRVISNIERVANLFVTKTIYAIFIAVAVGLAGREFPFLPRDLTLVGSVTIGIPAFFLALAPTTERAQPGFVLRVMRFAVPTGVAAGLATFFAYELALTEGVTRAEARTTATLVLAALGLFALGMVARPIEGWKKGLLWAMASLLVFLLIFDPSQEFFELDLPRVAVLLASLGIVAIAGGVMVGTLRAVGWIKHVPEMLRENPPDARRFWETISDRVKTLGGRTPPRMDREAFTASSTRLPAADEAAGPVETVRAGEAEPAAAPSAPPSELDPIEHARTIDWFDPDVDPIDILNEPTGDR
jgi:cation-transporting ATPase E